MSLKTLQGNMQRLHAENQQLHAVKNNLLRLLMQILIEHGGEAGELEICHLAANTIALERSAIDTLPIPGSAGNMTIRYRDTVLQPMPNTPRLAEPPKIALVEPIAEVPEPQEEPEEIAPPCTGCGHWKMEHIGGIGCCRLGYCACGGYVAEEAPVA
jgi:hypothetical protein